MPASRTLDHARARVIQLTSRLVLYLWLPLLCVQAVEVYVRHDPQAPFSFAIAGLVAIAVVVMWRPMPGRVAMQGTLFLLLVYSGLVIAFVLRGLQVRSTIACALLVVWATLFHGRRGLLWSLVALLPFLAQTAYRVGWRGEVFHALDTEGPGGAVRTVLWVAVGLILCGLVVRAALTAYEAALESERAALEAQHSERLARAAIEQNAEVLERRHLAGALAVGLAHDLNNAVQVAAMNAAIIAAESTGDAKEAADEILKAADRAEKMVRSLQSFGRAVSSEQGYFPVEDAFDGLRILLRGYVPRTVTATYRCDSRATLRGDELQFNQVLLNLVINAVDAMPAGGTLEVSVSDDGADVCVASVRDSGVGISDEVRARMFEPYFSTKPARDGGGLGLSMVARVVASVGGTIDVQSAIGKGSTFSVRWPVQHASAP